MNVISRPEAVHAARNGELAETCFDEDTLLPSMNSTRYFRIRLFLTTPC